MRRFCSAASASYTATDAYCNGIGQADAVSGLVVLSSVGATTMGGRFDLFMQTGDQVTGQFVASACPSAALAGGTYTCR